MMGFWRQKARKVIYTAYFEAKNNGLRGRAIRRYINGCYPQYGHLSALGKPLRAKYPYRVWLEELDALMYRELNGCAQMVLSLNQEEAYGSAIG